MIAPSRFGYLGSSLPPGVMPADQADAYALLLDALGIERAAMVGFSAGGPSVIQFALRHPDRTSGLILLGSALPGKAGGPPKPVARLLFTDPVFWTLKAYLPTLSLRCLGMPKGFRPTPNSGPGSWRTRRACSQSARASRACRMTTTSPFPTCKAIRWSRSACPR